MEIRTPGNCTTDLLSAEQPALMELLKRKPNIRNICLCLDNDSAGGTAAKEIAGKLRSMGYINIYERYPNEKDYNDELKKVKSIINEQAEENEQ